ncbi:MAG TPA: DUF4810 domain-containing protein [Holophaga sp.]|nr:DUF4810 domain-containing protein [Holophaga sp.]
MRKPTRLLLLAVPALLWTACKPPEMYHWGKYEDSLYKIAKDPTAMDRYGENLIVQINAAEGLNKVPPGIYAEYGYFLLARKRGEEAVVFFRKEKERWPESAVLMDRMIASAAPKPAEAPKPAPAPAPEVKP